MKTNTIKLGSYERGMVWNLVGVVLPSVVWLISIRVLASDLGVEKFGVFLLISTIIGNAGLFDFGMGRAITQRVASLRGQSTRVFDVFVFGLVITGATGLLGLLVQGLGSAWIAHALKVSPENLQDTTLALLVAAFAIPMTTMASGYRGFLEGMEDFRRSNIIKSFLGVALATFPLIAVVLIGHSLTLLATALVLARFVVLLLFIVAVGKHGVRYRMQRAVFNENKDMLNFGVWMTLSNFISPVLVNVDKFIITQSLGAAVVAYYAMPSEAVTKLLLVPGAIGASLLPRLSQLRLGNPQQEVSVYNKTFRLNLLAMSVLCLVAVFLAKPLLGLVGGAYLQNSLWITWVLVLGTWLNGLAYMPYSALHAHGKTKLTAMLHLAELLVYIPTVFAMTRTFGLLGAAIAWTLRVGIDFALLSYFYSKVKQP